MKLLASGLLLVAIAATSARADDVLVWLDAKLSTDPSGGTSIALATTKHDLGEAMVMHVVSTQGEMLEVEPVKKLACTEYVMDPPGELASFRMFVAKADLAPVVTTAWKDTWKDGGYIALEAGTPIDPAKGVVAHDTDLLPVDVPAKLVGTRYAGHAVTWTQPNLGGDVFLLDGDVQLGKHTVKVSWTAAKVSPVAKGKTAFPFSARCVKGTVVVVPSQVQRGGVGTDVGQYGLGGEVGKAINTDRWYLPKGTKLTAKGGTHVVGITVGEIDVPKPADPKADVCHDFTVGIVFGPKDSKPATLALCAPGSSVKSEIHSRF